MKKIIAIAGIIVGLALGVTAQVGATGDTGWSCPSGTVHTYKVEPLDGLTFTVPTPPPGWTVLAVVLKVGGPGGGSHIDFKPVTPGAVLDVSYQQYEISHAHICKGITTWPTTTTTTTVAPTTTSTTTSSTTTLPPTTTSPSTTTTDLTTTVPATTSTTTTVAATTSTSTTTAPTTTAPETTSTSSPSTSSPDTTSSVPTSSTSTTTAANTTVPSVDTTTTTTTVLSPTSTGPTPSSTPTTSSSPDPRLPETGSGPQRIALLALGLTGLGLILGGLVRRPAPLTEDTP